MATMTTAERIRYSIEVFDSQDPPQPAQVDGDLVVASSDETVLTIVPDPGTQNKSGFLVSVGPGVARMAVTADADLGAGVVTISQTSEDVDVTLDATHNASSFSFTLNAPEPKA